VFLKFPLIVAGSFVAVRASFLRGPADKMNAKRARKSAAPGVISEIQERAMFGADICEDDLE
jgi:hypothetical protein